jgi:rubrerythrin
MNIEEAIKTALQYEQKVAAVYAQYANKFNSETGEKVFKALAKEEADHVDYLNAKLAEWKATGKITVDKLDSVVPSPQQLKQNIQALKKIAKQPGIETEVEYFKKALEMETQTSNYYRNLIGQLDKDYQPLFQRFLEIEEGHEAIVKAEIDNATGAGFWFDFMEFSLESA